MDNSIIALFVADVILMAGIIYVIMRSRGKSAETAADAQANGSSAEAPQFTQVLKDEMNSLRNMAAELEKREAAIGLYENDIEQKRKRLDAIIKKAEEAARGMEASTSSRLSDDVYLKAMKMMNKGLDPEDVKKSLGLLNGEAELVSALKNYRA
ncbi:MAG: DUF2802 domain-containing protein [Deltaproteobacteria bacterium]|nr:DUF2802 domain-containing protein [Deltaproteobacteria bacterium]